MTGNYALGKLNGGHIFLKFCSNYLFPITITEIINQFPVASCCARAEILGKKIINPSRSDNSWVLMPTA